MKRAFEVLSWYGNTWNNDDPPPPPPPAPPDERHKWGDAHQRLASKDPVVLSRVGVVLGRFRPPHVGHVHLVEQAFAQCGWLHVVTPTLDGLGRELHDRAVRYAFGRYADVHPCVPPADAHDPAAWAKVVAQLDPRPTHLFSSDPGAEALARAAGLTHVLVDPARSAFPVSSTMIRADLSRHFALLAPYARAQLAFTVGIVGAEGSGKSTLARELAAIFDAPIVEDPLLAAAKAEGGVPSKSTFFDIYNNFLAGSAQRAGNETKSGIVISEASRLLTALWAKRLGVPLVVHSGNDHKNEHRHVWLLCHNDFPYAGARERDEPEARRAFFDDVRRELELRTSGEQRIVHVTGEGQARVQLAATAIRESFAAYAARVSEWMS